MKLFFKPEERKALIEQFYESSKNILAVFDLPENEATKMVDALRENVHNGITKADLILGELQGEVSQQLASEENRARLLDIIGNWVSIPKIDPSHAPELALVELRLLNRGLSEVETPIEERLAHSEKTLAIINEYVQLANKFPLMVVGENYGNLIALDERARSTIKPHVNFFKETQLDDIVTGNIDFDRIRDINKYHSPFTQMLLTLLEIEKENIPEGKVAFPLLSPHFFKKVRYDSKGIVKLISKDIYKQIKALDPRIYQFGAEGLKIRNWLTTCLLTDGAEGATRKSLDLLHEGKYQVFDIQVNHNVLQNVGGIFKIKDFMKGIDKIPPQDIMNPEKAIQGHIKRIAKEAHLKLSNTSLQQIAKELGTTPFYVGFRYMRNESNRTTNEPPEAINSGLVFLDPLGMNSFVFPALQAMITHTTNDMDEIILTAPQKTTMGKKFYSENKKFYEQFKKDKDTIDPREKMRIIMKAQNESVNKKYINFIDNLIIGISGMSDDLLKGHTNDRMMYYLSSKFPDRVIVEELNYLKAEDTLLGHAMNNCLSILDIIRYHTNNDAKIYCMWLNKEKVGISYDLLITTNRSEKKETLIDSIEVNDSFYDTIERMYIPKEEKLPIATIVGGFVQGYLTHRLQTSEEGLWILPESNNFQIRAAMEEFIEVHAGNAAATYQGTRVQTDTDFNRMPYWVDKKSLKGKTESMVIEHENGEVNISDTFQNGPIDYHLTPTASQVLNTQISRILKQ